MDCLNSRLKSIRVRPNNVLANVMADVTLSEEQKRFYDENGYLVLKQLIDFSTLYSCKQRFIKICNGLVNKGNMVVMKEIKLMDKGVKGEDLVNKIHDILYDDVFSLYTENPVLLNVISQFIGDDITAVNSMLINKPSGTGRHPPHQDLYYFPFRPADKIVAAWTAIDDVTTENGCLYVVPKSHKNGVIYDHGYTSEDGVINAMYHGIVSESTAAPRPSRLDLEMSPGDTVFFHPLLVHGSRPNVSKKYRKSISCHYASSHCHYIDVTGTNQHHIAREVEETARRRGHALPFNDIWKYKSKLVRGVPSKL